MKVSGGLLLLYGVGDHRPDARRPHHVRRRSLCALHGHLHGAYPDHRLRDLPQPPPRALPAEMRETYTTLNPGTLTTPESLQLSPRACPSRRPLTSNRRNTPHEPLRRRPPAEEDRA